MNTVTVGDAYHWQPYIATFGESVRLPDAAATVVKGVFSRRVISAEDPQRLIRSAYLLLIHQGDLGDITLETGHRVEVNGTPYRVVLAQPAVYGVVEIYCNDWEAAS